MWEKAHLSFSTIKRLDFVFLCTTSTATCIPSLDIIVALILVSIHCIKGITLEEQGNGQLNMFSFHHKLLVNRANSLC